MATPRTQVNNELDRLVSYCRVAQSHWFSLFKHTSTQTGNERAHLHAVATRNRTRGKKKNLSLPSWLPVWSHLKLWDLPCDAFLPICIVSEHCSFSQLSKAVCCTNWQGHLGECSSLPGGGTHKVVDGLYPQSLSVSAALSVFITGTTDSTIKKSCKSQVSATITQCSCTDFNRESGLTHGITPSRFPQKPFQSADEAAPQGGLMEHAYPPAGAQQRSFSNTGISE